MAYPVVESYSENQEEGGSFSLTITKPTGTAEGDWLIALIGIRNSTISSAPSGWTQVTTGTVSNIGEAATYKKKATGSEPSDYTWSFSSSDRNLGAIVRISGADATDAVNIANDATGSDYSGDPNACPDVTTTANECLILRFVTVDVPIVTPGVPTDHTLIFDHTAGSSFRLSNAGAYENQASAGSTGSATFTGSTSAEWVTATVAIQPAAGGGGAAVGRLVNGGLVNAGLVNRGLAG